MDYLYSGKETGRLDNRIYDISYDDIRILFEENNKDYEECKTVTQQSRNGESYYMNDGHPGEEKISDYTLAFFKEILYRDAKTEGFIMQYPHGTVITQGQRNHYYRGENQKFPTSLSSVHSIGNPDDKAHYEFLSWMRIGLFRTFLRRFDIVNAWEESDITVLYECLAQHYGLKTNWIDITNDFNVALFFATCYWDQNLKKWFPITKAQIQEEKEQYGMIYHIPAWQVNTMQLMLSEKSTDIIMPIGFQPFMRCQYQIAYGIQTNKQSLPLEDNFQFEKLRFKHNEKLSRDIFEFMDEGRKIYPQEGITMFLDVIDLISKATVFSEEELAFAYNHFRFLDNLEQCKKVLISKNICIQKDSLCSKLVSRQRTRYFNRKYKHKTLEEQCGTPLF